MQDQLLSQIADQLVPKYLEFFEWADVWNRPLEEGSAFEWTMLAALASQAERRGWAYSFPLLESLRGVSLFTLRNEIPRQHGRQPGHSGRSSQHSLKDCFFQAFVPKILLSRENAFYSLFREGVSYHQIMSNIPYQKRPDIIILPGHPTPGFPKLVQKDAYVDFAFQLAPSTSISGRVRVLNSPSVSYQHRIPQDGLNLPIAGIVECSVNKSLATATAQLEGYIKVFSLPTEQSPVFLVTGNELPPGRWRKAAIPLTSTDSRLLERSFRLAASLALDTFGIT